MKKTLALAFLFGAISIPGAYAQLNQSALGLFPPLALSPGDYTNYQKDQVVLALQKQWNGVRKEDVTYLENVVDAINVEFKKLLKFVYDKNNGIVSVSNSHSTKVGAAGKTTLTAEDYLVIVADIENRVTEFENSIAVLGAEAVSQIVKAYSTEIATNPTEGNANLRDNYSNLNFDFLKEHYAAQLKKLTDRLAKLPFNVDLPGGKFLVVTGFTPSDEIMEKIRTAVDPEDIKELKRLAKIERNSISEELTVIDDVNRSVKRMLTSIDELYGKGVSFRLLEDGDRLDRTDWVEELEDLFMTRTYIRALYGLRLGSITIDWQNNASFNLDAFNMVVKYKMPGNESVGSDRHEGSNDLRDAEVKVRQALAAVTRMNGDNKNGENGEGGQGGDIFNFDNDMTFLGRVLTARAFVTGNANAINIQTILLPMLYADIKQEIMLRQGGGRKKVYKYWLKTYRSSGQWDSRICDYFPKAGGCGDSSGDLDPSGDYDDVGSLVGQVKSIRDQFQIIEAYFAKAREYDLRADAMSKMNAYGAARDDREGKM